MPEIRVEGVSAELAARYLDQRLYRDNPVAMQSQQRVEPVYWAEVERGGPDTARAGVPR